MTIVHDITHSGQSVWLDYIRRAFLDQGGLSANIESGVRGVTSNPSIFEKAIANSADYDDQLRELAEAGASVDDIYEALVLHDIAQAADILRPIYDESGGADGYVSLEVSPQLAHDTQGTLADARRLFAALERPNVMIKVPATPEGIPAVQTLIGEGININVTLMFSLAQYDAVAEAYIAGLETLAANGGDLSKVASVASFFVSRVDAKVDPALEAKGNTELAGKIAVANARAAYGRFEAAFSGERWQKLAERGARVQRPLWASTSTKNPDYPDTLYVDVLIAPHTVNTMPTETLQATLDHGASTRSITAETIAEAQQQLDALQAAGVDLDSITDELLTEGVQKFAASFDSLMASIADKRERLREGLERVSFSLGNYTDAVDAATADLREQRILPRIWDIDHTVWSDDPTEISNRLGWLRSADVMADNLDRLNHFVSAVREDGYTNVLLLGMGGSSLAPEVFYQTFCADEGYPTLDVLDSTDPGQVLAYDRKLDPAKTLYIVATKSGGTAETLSFFKAFYNRALAVTGSREEAGKHFVAITDPGSKLETLADEYKFRATFLNDPNIGGRYSALSYFGIVPAALIGVDLPKLLDRAQRMAVNCDAANCPSQGDNNGGRLGAAIGELAKAGRDKLTFVISPRLASFGDWVEQLVAESTGKSGTGILPVVGEAAGAPDVYAEDRFFVYLRLKDDSTWDETVNALEKAGHPVARVLLDDVYDLGGQYFLWMMATAVAGQRLGIQPFDQPNVEAAKVLANQMIAEYQKTGRLPELTPALSDNGITVYGDVEASSAGEALKAFIQDREAGAYVSLQAYVQPTEATDAALNDLRLLLRDATRCATTVGYGPRFLHSTGQLHKGDAGNGLFIQFTSELPEDVPIPDNAGDEASGMSFGTLKNAQALGDRQALIDAGRRVIRFHLAGDIPAQIEKLAAILKD